MSDASFDEPLCSSWITGADVAACGSDDLGIGSDVSLLAAAAYDASWLLYEASGRKWPGVCERTVRPCRSSCGCWGVPSSPSYGGWQWGYDSVGGWTWRDLFGTRSCGCGVEDEILLAGFPIIAVSKVKIDGEVVDPDTYELVDRRRVLRLDDPGPPVVRRRWPACQNVTLPDTAAGTFAITYQWGGLPPPMGGPAAAQLARELWKACSPTATGECRLPNKVKKVVRQGVTYEIIPTLAAMLRAGSTGLTAVDLFVGATNPNGHRRRPLVWSPDKRRLPRRRA